MNRRHVLGALGATAALSAGCLSASDDPQKPANDEGGTTRPTESILQVSVEEDVPADIDPVDAVDAGLTENDRIAAALDDASDAYEDGMADDFGERGFRVLASVSADADDAPAELESGARFVEYEGVVYLVSYVEFSIET
ncbi:hypothetical protein [Natrialba asiatica]|uniref:Uncharacterized protein n=1 Tax=Natrialba asiatica (strain ATCC 700177 / DSM 12278 / JCM 9576 / FERM P-10747 / NBRC 102637 / 172P1) TaxID=29540 RepID=M0AMX5_NATA1|nr:hypothetical protein [Natrialba asiatica]ELZ00051.1 hypothetical protein C481_13684 [Natrialba asiatica DSM 12278]